MLEGLGLQLWLWLAVAAFAVWLRMRRGRASSGLVLTWIVGLWILNWLPAYVHETSPMGGGAPVDVAYGFPICLAAMVAGAAGIALSELSRRAEKTVRHIGGGGTKQESALLRIGLIAYASTMFGLFRFPSLTAILSTAANLLVLTVAWRLRRELVRGAGPAAWWWLFAGLSFPLVTTTVAGFIGYGTFSSLIVLANQVTVSRRRLWMLPVGIVAMVLSLSVFVTYMRDRGSIRDQVWGGEPLSVRAEQIINTFSKFETFSLNDPVHRELVILRLDQVSFVGAARRNLDLGIVEYARGETFVEAVLALIPRVLWPDKPFGAGSSGLVTRFTGQEFAQATSVGVTQVLEGYINFGLAGVLTLFGLLGFALGRADAWAGESLERGDFSSFLAAMLPAVGLLNVGGSLVETSVSMGAGFFIIWALRKAEFLSARVPAKRMAVRSPRLELGP